MTRPERGEAADYYYTYIDQVESGDVCAILDAQLTEATRAFGGIPETESLTRYAPDKWTIREVLSHIADTERVFAFRALWFARTFEAPLPGFDQDVAISAAGANDRPLQDHLAEFKSVRLATLSLLTNLPPEAWSRRGTASGNPFTVRALAYITAGHVAHHLRILHERYLPVMGK